MYMCTYIYTYRSLSLSLFRWETWLEAGYGTPLACGSPLVSRTPSRYRGERERERDVYRCCISIIVDSSIYVYTYVYIYIYIYICVHPVLARGHITSTHGL